MQYIWCRFLLPEEENRTPFSSSYHNYDLPCKTNRTFPFSISCTWLDPVTLLHLCRSSRYCRACCWLLATLRFLRKFWVLSKRGRGRSLIRFFCLLACVPSMVTNHQGDIFGIFLSIGCHGISFSIEIHLIFTIDLNYYSIYYFTEVKNQLNCFWDRALFWEAALPWEGCFFFTSNMTYQPWNIRNICVSLPLGMPFVSAMGVANSLWRKYCKKDYDTVPICAECWDPGCVCAEWQHGRGYTKYMWAVCFLGSQSVFFQQLSFNRVAARTLLKSYWNQAKPSSPPLQPYGPAEVNTWEMLCKCEFHPLVGISFILLKVNKLGYWYFLVTLNLEGCHLVSAAF